MSRIASYHNHGGPEGHRGHAPGPQRTGAALDHQRPLWPLVAATNQVLSAARWRRTAVNEPRQATATAVTSLHPVSSPTSGWFQRPAGVGNTPVEAAPNNGLRVVGSR